MDAFNYWYPFLGKPDHFANLVIIDTRNKRGDELDPYLRLSTVFYGLDL